MLNNSFLLKTNTKLIYTIIDTLYVDLCHPQPLLSPGPLPPLLLAWDSYSILKESCGYDLKYNSKTIVESSLVIWGQIQSGWILSYKSSEVRAGIIMSQTIMNIMMRTIKGHDISSLLDRADLSVSVYLMTSESDYSHTPTAFRCFRWHSLYSLDPYFADCFSNVHCHSRFVHRIWQHRSGSPPQQELYHGFCHTAQDLCAMYWPNTGKCRFQGCLLLSNALRYPQSQ